MAHPGGRPLKFKSVEELKNKIDEYFDTEIRERWTWTGLALYLDTSRETLREYQERPEFVDVLKRALMKVEAEYEADAKRYGKAGSIFILKNMGWTDRQEIDQTIKGELKVDVDSEAAAAFTNWLKSR